MSRPPHEPVVDYFRTAILWIGRTCLGRNRLLPLDHVLRVRHRLKCMFHGEDLLVPLNLVFSSHRFHGRVPALVHLLRDVPLGTWAVDQCGVELIWQRLDKARPRVICEFGSGATTLVFARWLKHAGIPHGVCISIDQSADEASNTRLRLESAGLSAFASVHHVPVDADTRFAFDAPHLAALFEGRPIDFVFVDGPAGASGCRLSTLPMLEGWLAERGVWMLHDALRDGELEVVQAWTANRRFALDGIYATGTGLAIGNWCK